MSGSMSLLHPEIYSDMQWLWRKQAGYSVEGVPASSLSIWQLFREAVIQRSLSNCVTLVCFSFTGCSKGLCGICWIYQSHKTVVLWLIAMLRYTNNF